MTAAIEGVRIGIDAVEVPRFRRLLERRPGVRERLFTEGELAYAARFADPAPRLAARFAVKEAAMKSLGVGLGAFRFRDVEVVRQRGGAPSLAVAGRASELAERLEVTAWRVSITHTDLMAEAVVLALAGPGGRPVEGARTQ
ncbi:MAG TPA: holo-ACP synthase [Acidimicrobiales bacterium]|nr:holo-ACP synthase [Acidimicrobiales bacterium]